MMADVYHIRNLVDNHNLRRDVPHTDNPDDDIFLHPVEHRAPDRRVRHTDNLARDLAVLYGYSCYQSIKRQVDCQAHT